MEAQPDGTPFLLRGTGSDFNEGWLSADSLRNSFDCQVTGGGSQMKWGWRKRTEGWEQLGSNVSLLTLWSYSAAASLYSSFSPLQRPLGSQVCPLTPADIWTSLWLVWCRETFSLAAKCRGGPVHSRGCCGYLLALLLSERVRASCVREGRHKGGKDCSAL